MAVAANVKAVGIGVALLVGAYIAYRVFSAASDAAGQVVGVVTAPNAFKVTSSDNLANKTFNALTGGPGSGAQQEWTVGTQVFDLLHTDDGQNIFYNWFSKTGSGR